MTCEHPLAHAHASLESEATLTFASHAQAVLHVSQSCVAFFLVRLLQTTILIQGFM